MNRREWLKSCLNFIFLGIGALILHSCGGSNYTEQPNQPPQPPVPEPDKIKVNISLSTPELNTSIQTETDRNISALEAIKNTFSYSRTAPIDELSQKTTISGITGYWKYLVNQTEPLIYIEDYILTQDCQIHLILM